MMEENPTTHPCFILMKNKKEKAFEKRKIKLWVRKALKDDNSLKTINVG